MTGWHLKICLYFVSTKTPVDEMEEEIFLITLKSGKELKSQLKRLWMKFSGAVCDPN